MKLKKITRSFKKIAKGVSGIFELPTFEIKSKSKTYVTNNINSNNSRSSEQTKSNDIKISIEDITKSEDFGLYFHDLRKVIIKTTIISTLLICVFCASVFALIAHELLYFVACKY